MHTIAMCQIQFVINFTCCQHQKRSWILSLHSLLLKQQDHLLTALKAITCLSNQDHPSSMEVLGSSVMDTRLLLTWKEPNNAVTKH